MMTHAADRRWQSKDRTTGPYADIPVLGDYPA
jgi:hypothetical protein